MKIRITKPGLYGSTGPIPVGTELELKEEPLAWKGRYEVVSKTKGKTAVANTPKKAPEASKEARQEPKAEAPSLAPTKAPNEPPAAPKKD